MSFDGWRTALVLGGIRSGKSAFAESLAGGGSAVRYVATAAAGNDADPAWAARVAAHRARRPQPWVTEELGADPGRLAALIAEAKPDEVLLVDDLGGWVTAQLDRGAEELAAAAAGLADAVRGCAARLVIVSPEAGLSVVPATELGRAFADGIGQANQAVAEACDAVVLVVAGQPKWLKRAAASAAPTPVPAAGARAPGVTLAPGAAPAPGAQPRDLPTVVTSAPRQAAAPITESAGEAARPTVDTPAEPVPEGTPDAAHAPRQSGLAPSALTPGPVIQPNMDLPLPDEQAAERCQARLRRLDTPGAGFGVLAGVLRFAASTQQRTVPQPWRAVRVLLVHGDHAGGACAGDDPTEAARRARQAVAGEGALGALVAEAGAGLQLVQAPSARPIENEDAITAAEVDEALACGWRLAEDAADSGVDLIVVAACGAGADTAAAAVTAALTGAEPVALLGRVDAAEGRFDDIAWMTRCATVRDALHRTRARPRSAHDVLATLGGGDLAIATGVLLGAAFRRTPVLLDGPVGTTTGLVSRELGGQARHWCLLPDHGGHPTARYAGEVLDLRPVLDLRLGLGEGASALAALPLLRAALTVAASLPEHPALGGDPSTAGPTGGDPTTPASA